jgi:anaerobic magnesium-protoporphyrin IX monomethyl ester cyclase
LIPADTKEKVMSSDDKMHSGRDEYQRDDSNIREDMYAGLTGGTTTTDQGNSHDIKGAKEKKKLFDILVKGKDMLKSPKEMKAQREAPEKSENLRILLVVYDNSSYMTWFPQGLGYVAAVLQQDGHDIELYNQDIHHYPDSHLTYFLDSREPYDAVCISVIGGYWQFKRLVGLSDAIENAKNRPKLYCIGGYGPTPEPEYFLQKTRADVCVMGEGEDTTRELFAALANNENYKDIKGIAYRDGNNVTVNPSRGLIPADQLENLDRIPMPAYDAFPMEYYRLLRMPHCSNTDFVQPVLSGRGCTFKCNFCYRMDTGFRPRTAEGILDEVEYLQRTYGITYVAFSDDLLMVSKSRSMELAEAFIKYTERTGLKFKWDCNGRLNYCTPEILATMKRAGCVYLNFGIEAFDNQILKNMKKGLNIDTIVRGVEQTIDAGMTPGLNFIWGNLGENKETLWKAVNFLKKYEKEELRTIRPVTPYPGSPLYHIAIAKGLIDKENPAKDFYENKHTNSDLLAVNFTDLSDDDFHQALSDANDELIKDHFCKKQESFMRQNRDVYSTKDASFRGFRQS